MAGLELTFQTNDREVEEAKHYLATFKFYTLLSISELRETVSTEIAPISLLLSFIAVLRTNKQLGVILNKSEGWLMKPHPNDVLCVIYCEEFRIFMSSCFG